MSMRWSRRRAAAGQSWSSIRSWRVQTAKPLFAGLTYPYDICFGTSPIQAAKSRPLVKASPAPIAATIALDMIGPIPGTLINRSHPDAQQSRSRWISLRYGSSSRRQSPPNRGRSRRENAMKPQLERAIGVIYRPGTERASHYFQAVRPQQFDEHPCRHAVRHCGACGA